MIDIISEKFSYLRHERNYKAISSLLEKIDYHKKGYWLLQQIIVGYYYLISKSPILPRLSDC